jgi:hypothetical protein
VWTRRDEDVLCFTTREHFTGLVPQLEADLKLDRKAAKKKMAHAEEAGDAALAAYLNNLQCSVKVLMNGLYGLRPKVMCVMDAGADIMRRAGGFGAARGGIFPEVRLWPISEICNFAQVI